MGEYEPPVYAEATVKGFRALPAYDSTTDDADDDLFPEPAPVVPPATVEPEPGGFQPDYVRQMLASQNIQGILTHYRMRRAGDVSGMTNDDVIDLAASEYGGEL